MSLEGLRGTRTTWHEALRVSIEHLATKHSEASRLECFDCRLTLGLVRLAYDCCISILVIIINIICLESYDS